MDMDEKATIMLHLPEELKDACQERAKSLGLSTSAWIRLVLMATLKEIDPNNPLLK